MSFLGRCLLGLFFCAVLFGGYRYIKHPQLHSNRPIDNLLHPADHRVRYRLGDIDVRFGLSEQDVKKIAEEAVQIWHDGTQTTWFVYDDKARLTINLIYDERQMRTNKDQAIQQSVADAVHHHNQQSDELDKQHTALHDDYVQLQKRLMAWQMHHNEIVAWLNQSANPSDRQNLQAMYEQSIEQKQDLDKAIHAYKQKQYHYNQAVDNFNANSKELDTIISRANQAMPRRAFHKGLFDGRQINIYEFKSVDDLRLTLAHELGHALGLGHHDEPTGLMHAMAGGQDLYHFKLQPADIELLNQRHFVKR